MDVPATQRGYLDVLDLAPKFASSGERAKWAANTFGSLRRGCRRHHGVVFDHYIDRIIKRSDSVPRDVKKLCETFVEQVCGNETDNLVRHLAHNFGLIYAGGVMAIRTNAVPWSEALVLRCASLCFSAARSNLNTESELLARGLRRLRKHAKKSTVLLSGGYKGQSLTYAGGYRRNCIGHTKLTVRAEVFKAWFNDPRQAKLVLGALQKQGRLTGTHAQPSRGQSIVWAETQPMWPDGSRPRSIVITLKPRL